MAQKTFTTEYELAQVMQRCHDILWERHGLDPAQAFDELSKLLFVKLYDETELRNQYATVIRKGESPATFATRIRDLFERACNASQFRDIFTGSSRSLNVDDLTIFEVFNRLQSYSLRQTTASIRGADIKGTAYESIIGNTFRGELGQFFTHRSIVEFMVRMVGVNEHKVVYDPACGSGGFLIMCAKLLREQILESEPRISPPDLEKRLRAYSRRCLIGTEINERTARVAKLNLLMHGLDYSNIYNMNALKIDADPVLQGRLAKDSMDVILANPPFAGYEKDPNVLSKFKLGQNGNGRPVAITREVLFIELIIRLLRDGGLAGIVIPQGIFSNRNLSRVRDFIKQHTQILAIIELPEWAFIPSGTSVRGSLLFVRKAVQHVSNYSVFMKRVEHIGFTSTGRPSEFNEFPMTVDEYRQMSRRYMVPISRIGDRLDAKFYVQEHREIIELFETNPHHPLVPLEDIGSFYADKYNPKKAADVIIKLIETSDVDPASLKITLKRVRGSECNYTCLKVLRAGDILISRRRAYRGAVVEIPPELDGAMAIPEFSVLRLRPGIDRSYVLEVLRSKAFLDLMTIYSTGEMSGRIAEKDLRKLKIPLPENHREIGARFSRLRERIAHLEAEIQTEKEKIGDIVHAVLEGSERVSFGHSISRERKDAKPSGSQQPRKARTGTRASARGRD